MIEIRLCAYGIVFERSVEKIITEKSHLALPGDADYIRFHKTFAKIFQISFQRSPSSKVHIEIHKPFVNKASDWCMY